MSDLFLKIIEGDVLDALKTLPDESVNLIVTSPPYWGLRDYGIDGQIGLEPTLDEYLDKMLKVTAELKRVLRKDGVMLWNHGDSYGGSGCGRGDHRNNNKRSLSNPNLYADKPAPHRKLRPKCMALQNYRLAIRMVDEQGWILRNVIIWCLSEDTKVFVKRGNQYLHIPIKDLMVGDMVFTMNMKGKIVTTRVKNKFFNGYKDTYKITTASGREVIATKEHEFPVKTAYYYGDYVKLHFKKVKDLTTRDYLWINYNLPILPKGDQNDYENGFIVGFFLAEGNFNKRTIGVYKDNKLSKYAQKRWGRLEHPFDRIYRVEFSCGIKDIEKGYIDYLKRYNVAIKNYSGGSVLIYSYDKSLINLIRKYVVGDTSSIKHLSQEVWNTSELFIKGVVDGFLAGDGYYDSKNDRWRVSLTTNYELRDDLMMACRLVGYEFRFEGEGVTNYGTKYIHFSIRKNIRRNTYKNMYVDKIESITYAGKKAVYDIEVEPIYTTYCGKGTTDKPSIEERKNRWNNLYFLANGVWTHNSKPNHMPSSAKDRFTNAYEPIFFFVKNKKYWSDLDAVREPHKGDFSKPRKAKNDPKKWQNVSGQTTQKIAQHSGYYGPNGELLVSPLGKNPGDVWDIPTQPFSAKKLGIKDVDHFATFPEELVRRIIKFGCPKWICKKCGKARVRIIKKKLVVHREFSDKGKAYQNVVSGSKEMPAIPRARTGVEGHNEYETIGWTDCGCNAGWRPGVVLDPFMGSGTTLKVARELGRSAIGIELNPNYVMIAKKRVDWGVGLDVAFEYVRL